MKEFTTKRVEGRTHVFIGSTEVSAGSNGVRDFTTKRGESKGVRGFSLIEALIAVTIVTLSVAGPLYTANRAIVAAQGARQQLVASNLAQEGSEHVHALRDNNYLIAYRNALSNNTIVASSAGWAAFTAEITPCSSATCSLDPTRPMGVGGNNSLRPCSGTCALLYLADNSTSKIYTPRINLGGTVTLFTRTIRASLVTPKDMRVVSSVSWTFHGTPYSITVSDHLTPWQ